jgi:putative tryptophan/tyrosine transport system substrate-binding protein
VRRREFITLLGGAAVAWPLAARAQQPERMRHIGVLTVFSKDDPEGQRRIAAFLQRLQELGWVDGRNVQIAFRWAGGDPDHSLFYAGELVGMKPDVILVNNALVVPLLQKETHIIPIVFVAIADPVVAGIVTSLARPGGNITGFTIGEYAIGGKRLEVLKEAAPDVARVTVILDPRQPAQVGAARAIEAAGPSFRVDVTMAGVRDGTEIERAIAGAAREPNSGLIVFANLVTNAHRRMIIERAARHRLPAIYDFHYFVAEGGLVSYGHDPAELYREAAVYVDRILKGAKAGELPVQNPTKYELVINLKTAKALGLTVPPTLLGRADEVIE